MFLIPVAQEGGHPIWVNVANVFDFDIVLYRVLDTKENPRCSRKMLTIFGYDTDGLFREPLLSFKQSRLLTKGIGNGMLVRNNSTFFGALIGVAENGSGFVRWSISSRKWGNPHTA